MYTREELKDIVNRAILNITFEEGADRLYDPVKYIISIGGKRIRPVMTLLACNLFSDNVDNAIVPSIGLEVFHNFTLVHDDIMDRSVLRRGSETVHKKWNENQAILSGDVMAFVANDCIAQAPADIMSAVFKIYNRVAREVCIGQQLDMDFETTPYVSHDEYLKMVELKTAVLIAGSLKIGALIGGANKTDCDLIYSFGLNLGLAFQVQDDILDTFGDPKVFGKKIGGDIVANKKTLLLIKAFELASGADLKQLQKLSSNKELDPEKKIEAVISIYNKLNIKEWAEDLAKQYIDRAYISLDSILIAPTRKEELQKLASDLIGRNR
jgi:geranylgeranyl diphosphate synthase type II